jgi:hypothetical protein
MRILYYIGLWSVVIAALFFAVLMPNGLDQPGKPVVVSPFGLGVCKLSLDISAYRSSCTGHNKPSAQHCDFLVCSCSRGGEYCPCLEDPSIALITAAVVAARRSGSVGLDSSDSGRYRLDSAQTHCCLAQIHCCCQIRCPGRIRCCQSCYSQIRLNFALTNWLLRSAQMNSTRTSRRQMSSALLLCFRQSRSLPSLVRSSLA